MEEQNFEVKDEMSFPKEKKGFGKGVAAGIIGTVIALCLILFLGCKLTGTSIVLSMGNGSGGKVESGSTILDSDTVTKINELMAYINLYYYEDEDVDTDTLRDSLYAGLVDGIGDKYSVYYNAQEYEDLQISTTGEYYGIGAGLTQDPDTMVVTISKVYAGTPSEEAGLLAEDIIASVDGVDATSMEVSDLVQLIRGEEGTTVHLDILRPSTGEELSFDVERANVQLPSVTYEMLNDTVGYIYLEQFEAGTAKQFETAVEELTEQGMQALVLDVRYNPGGMITSVVQILDDILPEGTVVYTEDKNGNRQDYTSDGESYLDIPIAVLINGDSASASEILAGAIKDYEYGTLIGTTTFGKGIVQTIFNLEDGDALKLTTAKYFTPNGNYIHGVGIEPDIELEYEYTGDKESDYDKAYDNQIQKAIEVLEEEMAE
ncbi:MAG: S41 family peptidase [Roseburia sp.]